MRRPTSDVRQRESRRSSIDNNGARRRNSSVPFHNARLERNPNSLDSDTDFLCDRAVEFMESGDIHSIVAVELAEQSMYFERLLRYHKGRGFIRLPEFLNSGFTSVLEFIRKGSTELNQENIYNIFVAADYLLVPRLKQECAAALKEVAKDPATAISLWLSCRSLYWPEVGTMAFQKILENFEQVRLSPEFLQLDALDVWLILREDGVNCKREKNVFDAVLQWLNYSINERLPHALDLLLCVRLGMLTSSELTAIKNHELLRLLPEYYEVLQEWPKCLSQTENPLIASCGKQFLTPRLPHEVIMVFGGWCDGEGPRAAAQVYNPRANTWTLWTESGAQSQQPVLEWTDLMSDVANMEPTEMGPMQNGQSPSAYTNPVTAALKTAGAITTLRNSLPPDGFDTQITTDDITQMENAGNLIGEIPRRVYAGCVLIGTRVYLVGGFDGTNALKSTLCYDFEIDSGWYEISCMYEKRYYVSVAYAGNHIYALGGHNGENQGRLDTAERYTMDENLWQTIASMNRVRSDAAAAELGGRVYVAGGFEGRRYHDSAEYYEAETNQWTLISRMHSPRGGISLAQQGGYLYAIGGNDGNSRLRTIERYDMVEGKWELVGQMNRRKSNLSSTVVNDDIYILGGWSDEPEAGILDLVERFDTTTRECHIVRPLTFPASATCACTLKDRNLVKKYIRPLPVGNSQKQGPQFGEFHRPNLGQDIPPNINQSSNAAPTMPDATISIVGQRNTNNQRRSCTPTRLNSDPMGGTLALESEASQCSLEESRASSSCSVSPTRPKRAARGTLYSSTVNSDQSILFEDEDLTISSPNLTVRKHGRKSNTFGSRSNHHYNNRATNRRMRSPIHSLANHSGPRIQRRASRNGQ